MQCGLAGDATVPPSAGTGLLSATPPLPVCFSSHPAVQSIPGAAESLPCGAAGYQAGQLLAWGPCWGWEPVVSSIIHSPSAGSDKVCSSSGPRAILTRPRRIEKRAPGTLGLGPVLCLDLTVSFSGLPWPDAGCSRAWGRLADRLGLVHSDPPCVGLMPLALALLRAGPLALRFPGPARMLQGTAQAQPRPRWLPAACTEQQRPPSRDTMSPGG